VGKGDSEGRLRPSPNHCRGSGEENRKSMGLNRKIGKFHWSGTMRKRGPEGESYWCSAKYKERGKVSGGDGGLSNSSEGFMSGEVK